jgi:hypothetical protein
MPQRTTCFGQIKTQRGLRLTNLWIRLTAQSNAGDLTSAFGEAKPLKLQVAVSRSIEPGLKYQLFLAILTPR